MTSRPIPIAAYLAASLSPDGKRNLDEVNEYGKAVLEEQILYDRAFADGKQEAEAAAQIILDEMRHDLERQAQHDREIWVTEESERLSQDMTLVLQRIESELSDAVLGLLKPFVKEQVIHLAIEDLTKATQHVLKRSNCIKLEITGSADLAERFRQNLPEGIAVDFVQQEVPALSVIIDKTTIETRLKEWFEILEKQHD